MFMVLQVPPWFPTFVHKLFSLLYSPVTLQTMGAAIISDFLYCLPWGEGHWTTASTGSFVGRTLHTTVP